MPRADAPVDALDPTPPPGGRLPWFERVRRQPAAAITLGLLVAIAAATWLIPSGVVLAAPHTDLINQFAASRAFAADSIRAGDFPFWNPFVFAGQPFLGGAQSGLLYPPNLVYLALPLSRAINFSILLHLAFAGGGMAYWILRRGWHPWAATLGGLVLPLSGAVLPHVYAGHLSNLCTLAWVPWAFVGLETWWARRERAGLLLASATIALQILGGQLQYVFFFGVAAALHAAVVSVVDRHARARAFPALILGVAGGCLLAAAQLWPSYAVATESVRAGRLPYEFAAVFALPPENLLTAFAPTIFGGHPGSLAYWARCYPWEMSVFVGLGVIGFATAGLWTRGLGRQRATDAVVLVLLLVLALGAYLPTYRLFYDHVPGFDRFRGMAKFTFPATLFALLLMARGVDAYLRGRLQTTRIAAAAVLVGIALAAGALHVRGEPAWFSAWFDSLRAAPENDFPAIWFSAPGFKAEAARNASHSLALAAVFVLAWAGALGFAAKRARWRLLPLAIIPLELSLFAKTQFVTSPLSLAVSEEVHAVVAAHPGDYRVLNVLRPNNGYLLGVPDIWGNDPFVLKRYAEFMAFTQQQNPDTASQNLAFPTLPPLYAMLRARFAFSLGEQGLSRAEFQGVLPRALLIGDYRVRETRDDIFAALTDEAFDPTRTVILETEPPIRPGGNAAGGTVSVVNESSDSLELLVDTPAPALLLVTDLYSKGWRVRALAPGAQGSYDIMPANYILRGIPLAAGRHRLRLEYVAPGFFAAAFVSGIAAVGWIALRWRTRRRPAASSIASAVQAGGHCA